MELQQDLIPQKKTIGALDHAVFLCMVFCFWFSGYIYVPVLFIWRNRHHSRQLRGHANPSAIPARPSVRHPVFLAQAIVNCRVRLFRPQQPAFSDV